MNQLKKLEQLAKENLGQVAPGVYGAHRSSWGSRCVLQLQYAIKLSESENKVFDPLVFDAIDLAWNANKADGAITSATTEAVEQALAPIAAKAKSYSVQCIGHAHIDMNWMWGYDETVSITLDTFRTMLDLMNEYPEFTFGQSQASTYEIVEKHCPEMIEEIKQRVHEGRWEVVASTWVEADHNMPNLESMARHYLYTKQYLSKLLDIAPATLNIDYEPDTFGHHINVPEVLCDGGVKYYYHCRGFEKYVLYNWKAPSGRSILVFREPTWYGWNMDDQCVLWVPEFCKKHGLNSILRVFGVGDHGGGPTRRDIERIIEMNSWPIFPAFNFGTYGQFYALAEKNKAAYPVVEGELNFIFDGCYTTQTRQKKGNRIGEAVLAEAEGASALAKLVLGTKYDTKAFTGAWQKVLFNQFHDILPGSGVAETREYAMGQYQEAYAAANTNLSLAVRALSAAADTSAFLVQEDISLSRSEGAGVGYGLTQSKIAQVGRHAGLKRLFTVYNPLPFERVETAEITVWDWNGDLARMKWADAGGVNLTHQIATNGFNNYWGHLYANVLVRVKAPAMGYTTIVLDEAEPESISYHIDDPRVFLPDCGVLENEFIRAEIDISNGGVVSLVDKQSGKEFVRLGCPLGVYRVIQEDTKKGMSAWTVGRYRNVQELNRGVEFTDTRIGPQYISQSITYEVGFGNNSRLTVNISLNSGEHMLRFDTTVRWQEIGTTTTFFPQLAFYMPVAYSFDAIRYDVPMGMIDRAPVGLDVPAQSFGMPINTDGMSLMLMSDSKYGYRGSSDALSLTLIRSSAEPDPWPEVGEHRIRLAIAVSSGCKATEATTAQAFCRTLVTAAAKAHKGNLPAAQSLLELEGEGLVLSAVKMAEDGSGIVVRYYDIEGKGGEGRLKFFQPPKEAYATNLLEHPVDGDVKVVGNEVLFSFRAFGVGSLLIKN